MIQLDGDLALVTAVGTDAAIHSRITVATLETRTGVPISASGFTRERVCEWTEAKADGHRRRT
jgi:hypothetical protein